MEDLIFFFFLGYFLFILIPFESGGSFELSNTQSILIGNASELLFQLQVFINFCVDFLQKAFIAV